MRGAMRASDNDCCITTTWWDPGDKVRAYDGGTMVPRRIPPIACPPVDAD
jgi:hypothetical protein